MNLIIKSLIVLIAIFHFYILWIEMFAWTTKGKKTFRNFPEHLFEPTKKMAANQGLYNGFLAMGLLWSLAITNVYWSKNIALFFLSCVAIAGLYGGYSVSKRIFFVQGIPALLAILLLFIS